MRRPASIAWLGAVVCLLARAAVGQGEVYVLSGLVPEERIGGAVAGVGDIDLDGVPDIAGGGGGGGQARIRVWSGATGQEILSIQPAPSSPATVTSLAPAGDVDADGVPDILAANFLKEDPVTGADGSGAVWVYSGADGSELHAFEGMDGEGLGIGVTGGADLNGDGHDDVILGAPFRRRFFGLNWMIVGGIDVRSGKDGSLLYELGPDTSGTTGRAIALLGDLDGDGVSDFAATGFAAPFPIDGHDSLIRWHSGRTGALLKTYVHPPDFEIGYSMASAGDLDGDGLCDVVVGNPAEDNGTFCPGTVRVFSSADASPLLYFTNQSGPVCQNVGRSVAGLGDFNGDGVPDIGVGTNPPASTAMVVSGATGQVLFKESGDFGSAFGFSVAGPGDLNGDGLCEFVVGHALSHPGNVFLAGSVHVYLAGCPGPMAYCTAKTNSQGCLPKLAWEGLLSLSIADNFVVNANDVVSQQLGMLLWSRERVEVPFQGGTLCLASPIHRLAPQSSGGNATPDCSGVLSHALSHDVAAFEGWTAGDDLFVQFWYRDPAHPDGTAVGLTGALRFQACP